MFSCFTHSEVVTWSWTRGSAGTEHTSWHVWTRRHCREIRVNIYYTCEHPHTHTHKHTWTVVCVTQDNFRSQSFTIVSISSSDWPIAISSAAPHTSTTRLTAVCPGRPVTPASVSFRHNSTNQSDNWRCRSCSCKSVLLLFLKTWLYLKTIKYMHCMSYTYITHGCRVLQHTLCPLDLVPHREAHFQLAPGPSRSDSVTADQRHTTQSTHSTESRTTSCRPLKHTHTETLTHTH